MEFKVVELLTDKHGYFIPIVEEKYKFFTSYYYDFRHQLLEYIIHKKNEYTSILQESRHKKLAFYRQYYFEIVQLEQYLKIFKLNIPERSKYRISYPIVESLDNIYSKTTIIQDIQDGLRTIKDNLFIYLCEAQTEQTEELIQSMNDQKAELTQLMNDQKEELLQSMNDQKEEMLQNMFDQREELARSLDCGSLQ